MSNAARPIIYLGSSRKDLQKLPSDVRDIFSQGLYVTSIGKNPIGSKVLKGFGSRKVVELIEDHKSDTYRAVYTIRFKEAVYQKKRCKTSSL